MPIGIVADWDYIVRTSVRARDDRVNPRVKPEDGHDEAGQSIFPAAGIIPEISLLSRAGSPVVEHADRC
jgi:hypothetical protein